VWWGRWWLGGEREREGKANVWCRPEEFRSVEKVNEDDDDEEEESTVGRMPDQEEEEDDNEAEV